MIEKKIGWSLLLNLLLVQTISPGAIAQNQTESDPTTAEPLEVINSVEQLRDVQPDDWAYQALKTLIERYELAIANSDLLYQGNRPLNRYEFAAILAQVIEQMEAIIVEQGNLSIFEQDLATVDQLRQSFRYELALLRARIDATQARVLELEATQFSTTTKLVGQALFTVNAGIYDGDNILGPTGALIAEDDPQATLIYRISLDLNTSFTGRDLLKLRLDQGSDGPNDNAAGFLEPFFGSVLDYSTKPAVDEFKVSRAYYTFQPAEDWELTVGPVLTPTDFIDRNAYTSLSFLDFSTQALVYNYVLFPVPGLGAGAAVNWNPDGGPFTIRSIYTALSGGDPSSNSNEAQNGLSPAAAFLYPDARGDRGLFGTPHQGAVELEYAPNASVALRLTYSGGTVYDQRFDVIAANFEWSVNDSIALFGRYGYGRYDDTSVGDIEPNYWMAGVNFGELLVGGDRSGIAVGQPFIVNQLGDATQTNIELYYNFPVNEQINLTPFVQIITNPANQNRNDTIYTGALRMVLSF